MTVQTLGNALLILLLIGWVGYRQLTWRPVVIAKMWRMPGILAVVGAVLLVQQVKPATITPLDLAVVAGEIVLSLAIGAWIGGIAHFREHLRARGDAEGVATIKRSIANDAEGVGHTIGGMLPRLGASLRRRMASTHSPISCGPR